MIGASGKRESRKSVIAVRLNDDDIYIYIYIYIYIVYHKSEYTPHILQIFKYISSWDNTDKMTLRHNEK